MSIYYGRTNAVENKGIRWNIIPSPTAPTNETEGHIGDVIVVSDDNQLIRKIKYIVNNEPTEARMTDNAIITYYDSTANRILVNKISNFNVILQSNTQLIVIDNVQYILPVFFYDAFTDTWVRFETTYRDNVNVKNFSGQKLDVDEVMASVFANIEESIDTEVLVPKTVQSSDPFDISNFSGANYLSTNIDTIMPSVLNDNNITISFEVNNTPII